MRGVVSPKLVPLLEQANAAIAQAKQDNQAFAPSIVRANLDKLAGLMMTGADIPLIKDVMFYAGAQAIPARLYNPNPEKTLPVLLHFHGGGHMCGSVELYDPISRDLALAAQAIVICIDYRLAPEFPYPAGVNDCQHVLSHYKEAVKGMKHNDTLYIAGDSAGGAISTTLVMNNIHNEHIKIDKQILIYPSVDYTMSQLSIEENGTGFLLEQDKISWYFEQYFQQSDSTHPIIKTASPLLGAFSPSMPKTLVITAGCDPLRDEGHAYVKALQEVGVPVTHHQFDDMIHAYMLLNSIVEEEYRASLDLISRFVAA
ncbi:alpha/beta hydrolase [Psychrobium sp. 1_MG-2023]|uniref:alpha/beta hydrolase n=1 Tax=Psychrobium sp. 1_MG-2023 TaxID=3062624 RepID=UPI000C32FBAB|nr:alpha/beta hydrolase [Psychrobium sp. 1_MG-2023]MDP2562281.1 alpha/beta hydrolase [Psychrobium sp. 1_MG-2023]PKF54664.1 alpha/beta hydrolase [Alteromonadales bacterium alter-6D02]